MPEETMTVGGSDIHWRGSNGTGGGNTGGGGSGSGVSGINWSVLKYGDTIKTKWGTIRIDTYGRPVVNGVIMTYENSSLVEDGSGRLVRALNSAIEKDKNNPKNYGNNQGLSNVKYTGKNPVAEYSLPLDVYNSVLKGIIPNGYWVSDNKVMTKIVETYEINGGGKGNDRIGTKKYNKEIVALTNTYERGEKDRQETKDALKKASGFFNDLYGKFGENQEKIAKELFESAKDKKLRSIDDAIKSYGTFKGNFDKLHNESRRKAISLELKAVERTELVKNLKVFGKAFGLVDKTIDGYDLVTELRKSIESNNWRPFFVKAESIFAGLGASWLTAWSFSIILATPLGVVTFAVIMASVSALVDEKLMEKINKSIGV
ncbi:colicin-like pore-forming protein [Raoultella terrigena]